MQTYAFTDTLRMSRGYAAEASIESVLLGQIPGALEIVRSTAAEDRSGTDYWVKRECGRDLSVDAKVRAQDWASKGKDDLALETWSVVERRIVGWTLNPAKQTDYILWLWKDTGRWCLVPFPMLCAAANKHVSAWSREYQVARQYTDDRQYHSECVFVPRRVVWRAIYDHFAGAPA